MTERVPGEASPAGAYAIVRSDEPVVFLAENADVISRALALHLVAQSSPSEVTSAAHLNEMRRALLEERWADALLVWMEDTGVAVDVYDEIPRVWTQHELDLEQASMEIRMSPLFAED